MTNYEMSVNLPCAVRYERETMTYVSECLPLNIQSAGDTEDEAIRAIQSAVTMYLQSAIEDGLIGQILMQKGFRLTTNPREIREAEQFVNVKIQEEERKLVPIKVPIGLLETTTARV